MGDARTPDCLGLNRPDVVKVMAKTATLSDLDRLAIGMGEALSQMWKELIESTDIKRASDLMFLREENAKLLVRVLALEGKGRPSEETVVDIGKVLRKRRAA